MEFTEAELLILKNLLLETAQQMDDDGREGEFDHSPLKPVYNKIIAALKN